MNHPPGQAPGLVFVRHLAPGRDLRLTRVRPESNVLHDGDTELGPVNADLHPFLIDDGDRIVFAGTQGGPEHVLTLLDDHPYPVYNGVWLSHSQPFEDGIQVTGVFQDNDGGELYRLKSGPLSRDRLEPLFGPSWTLYGPRIG